MEKKSNIAQEFTDLQINLPVCPMPASMQVPTGYFTDLSENVLAQIKQEDFLASLPKNSTFELPNGYFEDFAANLSTQLALESLPKTMPFEVPSHYFEDFSAGLSTQIAIESLPKTMPFEVPTTYFENLHEQVLNKINAEKPALKPLRAGNHRYAYMSMAATILLFLGLSLLFLSQKKNLTVEQQLSMMPDTEVNDYIKNHQNEFETDVVLDVLDESHVDFNSLEAEILDKQLKNISDEEIASFIL